MRKLMRMLVANGCPRSNVGKVLSLVAAHFGVKIGVASRRTVSRVVLEGYIASKMQIGFEIGQAPGMHCGSQADQTLSIPLQR